MTMLSGLKVEAVDMGHLEVRDHEVEFAVDEDIHRLPAVADPLDLVTVTSQQFRQVIPT